MLVVRLEELEHTLQRYQWDIIGLLEMNWTGIGETTTEDGHKLWYSVEDTRHQHGVGFKVNKKVKDCVLSCKPILSRLITILLLVKPMNTTIIWVYAPTSDLEDPEVEGLYEEMEKRSQERLDHYTGGRRCKDRTRCLQSVGRHSWLKRCGQNQW